MEHHLNIVLILSVGFAVASLLGYLMQRLGLPSMIGYLLAGYIIGPYSPGFVADLEIAEELAQIGVILMLFGVGLHFRLEDLLKVKNVAIPGAIGQTLLASLFGCYVVWALGWPLENGVIIGMAISVASTVVLVRELSENAILDTTEGHIAVGWLIVEDLLTVLILLLLPSYYVFATGQGFTVEDLAFELLFVTGKFVLLALIIFSIGQKLTTYLLTLIARLRSHELFTITMLALIFVIATCSSYFFGVSIALGAFLAGMLIGQTDVRHQAAANALPVKDIFAVVFFLSVGMLFNPAALVQNWALFLSILGIILLFKPLVAYLLVRSMGYSAPIGRAVGISLSQIGEFSFILAEEASTLKLLPDVGYDLLVGCALVSIALNPLLFRLLRRYERRVSGFAKRVIKARSHQEADLKFLQLFTLQRQTKSSAVVVGYGPVGQAACDALSKLNKNVVIIEQNIDTVPRLKAQKLEVLFGDAAQAAILESAGIKTAKLLVITIPDIRVCQEIIHFARALNPHIFILVRVTYLPEVKLMQELKVKCICAEKEIAKAFSENIYNLVKYI